MEHITPEQKEVKSYVEGDGYGLIEYKADKMPVGNYVLSDNFNSTAIPIIEGDIFYSFSDGFADQFGGENGKKYKYRKFKKLLVSIASKPMKEQEGYIKKEFVGGCDIMKEMAESGELIELFNTRGIKTEIS